MKKTFKRIAAVLAAASVIGTCSIGASAATKDDVIAAARGANFKEHYVQQLINFLNTSKFTESQYDIMIGYLYDTSEEMNKMAWKYFGVSLDDMKNSANSGSGDSENKDDDKSEAQDWVEDQLKDVMTEEDIMNVLDHLIEGGKELGLDITVESKGDKNFTMTVKDKDGNVQFVAPIGKLIDRTGVEEAENSMMPIAVSTAVTAAGLAGAVTLVFATRKNEE